MNSNFPWACHDRTTAPQVHIWPQTIPLSNIIRNANHVHTYQLKLIVNCGRYVEWTARWKEQLFIDRIHQWLQDNKRIAPVPPFFAKGIRAPLDPMPMGLVMRTRDLHLWIESTRSSSPQYPSRTRDRSPETMYVYPGVQWPEFSTNKSDGQRKNLLSLAPNLALVHHHRHWHHPIIQIGGQTLQSSD